MITTLNILSVCQTLIKHVATKIWDQIKHTPNGLRMSIIYVALVKNVPGASPLNATDYIIRPVFRTMKCTDWTTGKSNGKCMVFVDEFGWVYQNWVEFMQNTLYPDTMIVAPERGVFMRNNSGTVQLIYFPAPLTAAQIESRKLFNVGLTVSGLGATSVLVGAAFFPVTAPFVWGAAIVGGVVAAVSGAQSVSELVRRNTHEQDISLSDEEARAHWLAISGTVLGFAAAGASSIVRGAATAGTVSKSVIYVSNTVCVSSMVVNGVAVSNGIFTAATSDRDVSASEIMQLSVSLFLFTHSMYNYKTAQAVIKETQAQHLSDYKQTLSKNGQRNFQKKMNARVANSDSTQAMGDTIRNLKTADHYNNNFKGTPAFQSTTTLVEDTSLGQKLMSTMNYAPIVIPGLVTAYKLIINSEAKDYWHMFDQMANLIINRLCNGSLTLDNIIMDIFLVIRKEAKTKKVHMKDLLERFEGTFESIPRVVREYFAVFERQTGPFTCKVCSGCKVLA